MKRLALTITIAACLIFLIAANSTEKQEIDYREMAEDIEIMSRIFDKKLKDEFGDEYFPGRLFEYYSFLGKNTKCKGVYLPDFGVTFTIAIKFPVAKIEQEDKKAEAEEPSLWKQMEYEIKNQATPQRALVVGKSKPYEEEKVKKLKELILSTISQYALNIAQLNPDDKIAIVVYGDYSVENRDMLGDAFFQFQRNRLNFNQDYNSTKAQAETSENLELDELKKAEIRAKVNKVAEVDRKRARNEIAKAETESKIAKEVDKLERETDKSKDQKSKVTASAVQKPTLPTVVQKPPQISKPTGYSSIYTDLSSEQYGTVLVISVARKYIEDKEQLKKHANILQY